jgi:uncharacterized protein
VPHATFRLYAELNDFLPRARRQTTIKREFDNGTPVKDLLEAIGVPHAEIELVVVNGRCVGFGRQVLNGDLVSAYPKFHAIDIGAARSLAPAPQVQPRFIADVHLGRLAAYLRAAGIDTLYRNNYDDLEIITLAVAQDRTILTRDVALLKHGAVTRGRFIRHTEPAAQLLEVVRHFELARHADPFSRCPRCNAPIREVPKAAVEHLLAPRTREHYHEFSQCQQCAHVYWRGSHYIRMRLLLDHVFADA